MKLLNDFFRIVHVIHVENVIQVSLALNANHIIYAGHFPLQPVTPGVIQLQIVEELLCEYLSINVVTQKIKYCKFLNILNPFVNPDLEISIEYQMLENNVHLKAIGSKAEIVFFKLDGIIKIL